MQRSLVLVIICLSLCAGKVYGQTDAPLREAIERRRWAQARTLLQQGALAGTDVLGLALTGGNSEIVQMLLSRGVRVFANSSAETFLAWANANRPDPDVFRLLIQHGAEPYGANRDGKTALYLAVERRQLNAAKRLLNMGFSIYNKAPNGNTLLYDAMLAQEDPEFTRMLLREGVEINARCDQGATALHIAVRQNYLRTAQILLNEGANPNIPDQDGYTPTFYACASLPMLQLLARYGARLDRRNDGDAPLLVHACGLGNRDTARYLLAQGASVQETDAWGDTPLHRAASRSPAITRLLLQRGASLEAQNRLGQTPLHKAAQAGQANNVKSLLRRGANANRQDRDGSAALILASTNLALHGRSLVSLDARKQCVVLLLRAGADPTLKDHQGKTALQRAQEGNLTEIVELLRRERTP